VRKNGKSGPLRKAARQGQLWLHLPGLVREALYKTVIAAGLACVDEVLEAERSRLCGARYQHRPERRALRAGHSGPRFGTGQRRVQDGRRRGRLFKVHPATVSRLLASRAGWSATKAKHAK
jgi:hypothetical protein